jgi:hypothetical protein
LLIPPIFAINILDKTKAATHGIGIVLCNGVDSYRYSVTNFIRERFSVYTTPGSEYFDQPSVDCIEVAPGLLRVSIQPREQPLKFFRCRWALSLHSKE